MKIIVEYNIEKCGAECPYFHWIKTGSKCDKGNFIFSNYSGDFPDNCPFKTDDESKDEFRGC